MGATTILITSIIYLIGCTLLIPGTFLLITKTSPINIIFIIAACLGLFLSPFIELISKIDTKPSSKDIADRKKFKEKMSDWKLDLWISIVYTAGGFFYFFGAVLFLPPLGHFINTWGYWLFRCGSVNYITWSILMYKQISRKRIGESLDTSSKYGLAVLMLNALGSVFFICGGIISQNKGTGGTELWFLGSFCFTLVAFLAFQKLGDLDGKYK